MKFHLLIHSICSYCFPSPDLYLSLSLELKEHLLRPQIKICIQKCLYEMRGVQQSHRNPSQHLAFVNGTSQGSEPYEDVRPSKSRLAER